MFLYKLSGIISVVLLGIMVILILIQFKKFSKRYLSLGVYLVAVFTYEFTMLITSIYQLNNHIGANLHSLLYLPLISWVLADVYKRIYAVKIPTTKFILIVFVVVVAVWLAENFLLSNVFVFNSLLPVISAVLVSLVGVYLLNILLFMNRKSHEKQADVLIIAGVMVRSVSFGFMLWLLNFNKGYEKEFYTMLVSVINMGLCVSDVFFLLSILRISGMNAVVKRKTDPLTP